MINCNVSLKDFLIPISRGVAKDLKGSGLSLPFNYGEFMSIPANRSESANIRK